MNNDKNGIRPTESEIATQAYILWQADGGPSGRDLEYWLRAEALVKGTGQTQPAQTSSSGTTPSRDASTSDKSGKKRKIEQRPTGSKQPAFA